MFMLEGTWRGYRSSQDHVCHREYFSATGARGKAFLEWLRKTHAIDFTDGTALLLSVTDVGRKALPERLGYKELIHDCFFFGATSVAEVNAKRKAMHEAQLAKVEA